MLFSSPAFIFVFLPAVLAGYFILGHARPRLAIIWVVLASLIYYAQWNAAFIHLLLASVAGNYLLSRALARWPRRWLLVVGIGANLAGIVWFKYANFFVDSFNAATSAGLTLPAIVLPLAISFYTFQQIGYLVEVYDGQPAEQDPTRYAFFVLFFPQLISGPIVQRREVLEPLHDPRTFRVNPEHLTIGLAIFALGLFKKVCLADPMAPFVNEVFADAATGAAPAFGRAWIAAFSYALQLYFDFSGYSDMALGIALMFNIRLPINFWSPYKSPSIIEFWSRWHMSLTRFLTAYVYNPIAMHLTQRRTERGLPILRRSTFALRPFLVLVAAPTLVTMLLSGLWHGAGWHFVVWGLLHGLMLVVNQAWRALRQSFGIGPEIGRPFRPLGVALTFLCVVVTLVIFKANDLAQALTMLKALAQVPTVVGSRVAITTDLPLVVLGLMIVFALPNTLEWIGGFRPEKRAAASPAGAWAALRERAAAVAVAAQRRAPALDGLAQRIAPRLPTLRRWTPSFAGGVIVGVVTCFALIRTFGVAPAEFLYFTF
jgi:alginate O-acetyltransferase complex protein AlgI